MLEKFRQNIAQEGNGFSYNFTYDLFGRAESTKVGNQVLNTNTYNTKGLLSKTAYGNGDYMEPVYNNLDQITQKTYNGAIKYKWEYGSDGSVNKYSDLVNNVTYRYEYDLAGRLRRVYGSDGYKQRNLYDAKGNIYNTLYTFENNSYIKKYSNNYVYGHDNRLTQVHFNQTGTDLDRTYDTLGRVTQKKYSQWGGAPFFTTSYSFLDGENGNTTGMLSSINNNGENLTYTYDNCGNITGVSGSNQTAATYSYDEQNQLKNELLLYNGSRIVYKYDAGGNIISKERYFLTSENPIKTDTYTYGDPTWKDLLTAYNGKAITYDEIGNPETFDGKSFEWTGRQLDSISGNGNTITYKYNANGIRTEKTVNGVTTKYFIEGDRIVLEKVGNEERTFWYDGNGQVAAFVIYDSTGMHPYYYIRNGQGDVIGLFDANGTIVARYTYDSWGNLLKITDGSGNDKTNDTTFVGYKNPIRYRGYYYDSETKLYYLQSRYYNPEWGRFINADGFVSTGQGLTGTNMFAYCNNNPIMMVDPNGRCSYCGIGSYNPADMPWSAWQRHLKTSRAEQRLYDTPDEAAVAFAEEYGTISYTEDIEYASVIYKVYEQVTTYETTYVQGEAYLYPVIRWNTHYSYTKANRGTTTRSFPGFKATMVSNIHTHGCQTFGYLDQDFSRGFGYDTGWADMFNVPIYLLTPSHVVKKYDPSDGSVTEIGSIPW